MRQCGGGQLRHLRRLDVVRRYDERGVGAEELGFLGGGDGGGRANRAGADDDGQIAAHLLTRDRHNLGLLVVIEAGGLAGRAQDNDTVRALLLVPLQQLAQRGDVDIAILLHRSRERHERAGGKRHAGHHHRGLRRRSAVAKSARAERLSDESRQ